MRWDFEQPGLKDNASAYRWVVLDDLVKVPSNPNLSMVLSNMTVLSSWLSELKIEWLIFPKFIRKVLFCVPKYSAYANRSKNQEGKTKVFTKSVNSTIKAFNYINQVFQN